MPYTITPSAYAREKDIRPQRVFNWIKKGAPHEKRDKVYIDPVEIEAWLEEQAELKAKKLAAPKAPSAGASYFDDVPEAYLKLLGGPKSMCKLKHFCMNCECETEFLTELFWNVDSFHFITSFCLSCRQNKRWLDVEDDQVLRDLLDEKRSWFVPGLSDAGEREELKQFQKLRAGV